MIALARKTKTKPTLLTAATYIRMSSGTQKDSPEQQRHHAKLIAERHGCNLAFEYCDEARSGTTAKGRDQFKQMLKDAAAGKFEALILWDTNRLSREDCLAAAGYYNELRRAGVRIFTTTGEVDLSTPMGRMWLSMSQEGNHDYSVKLSNAVCRGLKKAAESGRLLGSMAYAYDREVFDAKGKLMLRVSFREKFKVPKEWTARLAPSAEVEAVEAVRMLFAKYATGMYSQTKLAKTLNRMGVRPMKTDRWDETRVHRILQNPIYMGVARFGRHKSGRFHRLDDSGEISAVAGDKKEWGRPLVYRENAHPPIVSRQTWEKCQTIMAQNSRSTGERPRQNNYILNRVIFCGHCGKKMHGNFICGGIRWHKKGRENPSKRKEERRYKCPMRNMCDAPISMSAERTEQFVIRKCLELVLSDDAVKRIKPKLMAEAKARAKPQVNADSLQRRIAQLESKIERGKVSWLEAAPEDKAFAYGKVKEWREELERLKAQRTSGGPRTATEIVERATAELVKLRAQLAASEPEKLRAVLERLVKRLTFWWESDPRGSRGRRRVGKLEFNDRYGIEPVEFYGEELHVTKTQTVFRTVRDLYKGQPVRVCEIHAVMGGRYEDVRIYLKRGVERGQLKHVGRGLYVPVSVF